MSNTFAHRGSDGDVLIHWTVPIRVYLSLIHLEIQCYLHADDSLAHEFWYRVLFDHHLDYIVLF